MGNRVQADLSLRASSSLTLCSQTPLSAAVCDAMNLQPGENIEEANLPGGKALISRQERVSDDNPFMAGFLSFLAEDMRQHPDRIKRWLPHSPQAWHVSRRESILIWMYRSRATGKPDDGSCCG